MNKFTIEGLKNDPKLRLELYESMLIDWEKPIVKYDFNNTSYGFCLQLRDTYGFSFFNSENLPELYKQRITSFHKGNHYHEYGTTELGRSQRVTALKNAIAEVKKLINL